MQAVSTLYYGELFWFYVNHFLERSSTAIPWTIGKGHTRQKWGLDFRLEAFVVHIPAGLGETLRCPLFGAQKEVIHVEYVAVVTGLEVRRKSRFAGGGVSVYGDADMCFPL